MTTHTLTLCPCCNAAALSRQGRCAVCGYCECHICARCKAKAHAEPERRAA